MFSHVRSISHITLKQREKYATMFRYESSLRVLFWAPFCDERMSGGHSPETSQAKALGHSREFAIPVLPASGPAGARKVTKGDSKIALRLRLSLSRVENAWTAWTTLLSKKNHPVRQVARAAAPGLGGGSTGLMSRARIAGLGRVGKWCWSLAIANNFPIEGLGAFGGGR